jgi:hypothetical protein
MNLSAFIDIASVDKETLNSSLSNDMLFITQKSNQKFLFGNYDLNTDYLVIHSNIGIGTSMPTSKLHVLGDGYFSCNLATSGNVCIGYSNPSYTLDVYGTSYFRSNLIVNSSNTTFGGTLNVTGASAFSNTSIFTSNLIVNSKNTSLLGTLNVTGASAFSNTTTFSSNLIVSSYNTSLLGTLNVSGASAFSNTSIFTSNLIVSSKNTTLGGTLNVSGVTSFSNNIYVGTPGTDSNAIFIYGGYSDINSNYSGIMRRIYNSAEQSELAMFCYNDIATAGVGPDRIRLIGANILLDTYSATTESINNTDSTSTKLIITSDGNVGIGTMTSSYKLRVEGNTYISTDCTINNNCTINNILYAYRSGIQNTPGVSTVTSTGERIILYPNSGGYNSSIGHEANFMWFNVDSTVGYKFYNASSLKMIFDKYGNLGIGTDNPSSKLHIVGDSYTTGIIYANNTSYTGPSTVYTSISNGEKLVLWKNYPGGYNMALGVESLNMWFNVNIGNGYKWYIGGGSSLKMTLNGDGNLGLGTDTPDSKLNVNGIIHTGSGGYIRITNSVSGATEEAEPSTSTSYGTGLRLLLGYAAGYDAGSYCIGNAGPKIWYNVPTNTCYHGFYFNGVDRCKITADSIYLGNNNYLSQLRMHHDGNHAYYDWTGNMEWRASAGSWQMKYDSSDSSFNLAGNLNLYNNKNITIGAGTISCGNINTNGYTITAGPVNCGAISCSTINTNGYTITSTLITTSGGSVASPANDLTSGWRYICYNGGSGNGSYGLGMETNTLWIRSANTIKFYIGTTSGGTVTTSGFTNPSSIRLKKNIEDISDIESENILNNLRPVKFNWISDETKLSYGFIAEEVENIDSTFVSYNYSNEVEGLNYTMFIPILQKELKKTVNKVNTLTNEINDLKFENNLLKNKLDYLYNNLNITYNA